ncbi:hypothetical protein F4778DRAFT_310446 [Xylariomycetidae sp. FL2044]|nr:hypothetical protein F4778DRAFT_310446 [Xylariomycetidae sp. FL2044]
MDATAPRGRGRSSTRKRHTLPGSSSSQKLFEVTDHPFTPTSATPSTANMASSFSLESPSPSNSRVSRTRTRVVDGSHQSPDEIDSKGGRSLRKRARVDYTFDQPEDEEVDPSKTTPITTRAIKRRRTDVLASENDVEDDLDARSKRRASEQPAPSLHRRRNTPRRPTAEPQHYSPDQTTEDAEVQDTIEVGGHQSEISEGSSLRRTSSGSSTQDSKSLLSNTSGNTVQISDVPLSLNGASMLANHHMKVDDLKTQERSEHDSYQQPSPKAEHEAMEVASLDHLTPYLPESRIYYPVLDEELDGEPDTVQDEALGDDALDATTGGLAEDTPTGTPGVVDTAANSPAADPEPLECHPVSQKQYAFKQTRNASEFVSLFEDVKSLSHNDLYKRLEVTNRALVAWQREFNELRKLTDDADNSARYANEENTFNNRLKTTLSKNPAANPVQKAFVIKGYRAEKPDPLDAYYRQQDRIMANAYLFEYDERPSMIGQQDPKAQKSGAGKGRLRDRPKQTAKAAEADDANIIQGKRTRKPPAPFEGEAASRGATPLPAQPRRRRRAGQAAEEDGEANVAAPTPVPEPIQQETPKKKGKGGRPRKKPIPASVPEETFVPEPTPAPEPSIEPQQEADAAPEPSSRKRKRRAQPANKETAAPKGTKNQAPPKPSPRGKKSRPAEVPSSSFYTTSSMASAQPADESRPPTSSSTTTVSTLASNSYQLREKRQRKFTLNDSNDEYEEEPKPKRIRRTTKKAQEAKEVENEVLPLVTNDAPTQKEEKPAVPLAPKPLTKIRIKNYVPLLAAAPSPVPTSAPTPNPPSLAPSSTPTPSLTSNGNNSTTNGNSVNGDAGADQPKDYNSMTKSEKMSASMKARWASGSMSDAVKKRRVTLANKKQVTKPELGHVFESANGI